VGAGLLANAVYQSASSSLTHRIREQARSHIWIFIGFKFLVINKYLLIP
jgi:hypothetical protein